MIKVQERSGELLEKRESLNQQEAEERELQKTNTVKEAASYFKTASGQQEIKKAMKGADKKKHFDRLLGLTSALKDMDMWLHDNECWGDGNELDGALKLLGQTWKKLLKSSDAVLGIDKEFTRPGIEALLEDLEEMVSECSSGDYTLPWK